MYDVQETLYIRNIKRPLKAKTIFSLLSFAKFKIFYLKNFDLIVNAMLYMYILS